jgi:hypothetical protein
VPGKDLPAKKSPLVEGETKRKDQEPLIWCHRLGVWLDKYRAGELQETLRPRDTLEKQLANLDAFRGATMTKQMSDYLHTQRAGLANLKDELAEKLRSDQDRLTMLKGQNKKLGKHPARKLTMCAPSPPHAHALYVCVCVCVCVCV